MARIDPIAKDLAVIIDEELSPAAQSRALAAFARSTLQDAQAQNRAALGRTPAHRQYVDRREGADLESVRPSGVIVFEFDVAEDITAFILEELQRVSPVDSGDYKRAHMLFADGRQVLAGEKAPEAETFLFCNPLPYARRIEAGTMRMRVDGTSAVYQQAARAAQRRFGNMAAIKFTYTDPPFGGLSRKAARAGRIPALTVQMR